MGKRINPATVGAFVLGAIGLILAAVVVFGSGNLFRTDARIRHLLRRRRQRPAGRRAGQVQGRRDRPGQADPVAPRTGSQPQERAAESRRAHPGDHRARRGQNRFPRRHRDRPETTRIHSQPDPRRDARAARLRQLRHRPDVRGARHPAEHADSDGRAARFSAAGNSRRSQHARTSAGGRRANFRTARQGGLRRRVHADDGRCSIRSGKSPTRRRSGKP